MQALDKLAARLNTANTHLLQDEPKQAVAVLTELISDTIDTPLHAAATHNLGLAYEMQQDLQAALDLYVDNCNNHPSYYKSLLSAANCLVFRADMLQAIKLLHAVIRLNPKCAQAYNLLSQTCYLKSHSCDDPDVMQYHQQTVCMMMNSTSHTTRNYAQCYMDAGDGLDYHMFWADSALDTGFKLGPEVQDKLHNFTPDGTVILVMADTVTDTHQLVTSIAQTCPHRLADVVVVSRDAEIFTDATSDGSCGVRVITCACSTPSHDVLKMAIIHCILCQGHNVLYCTSRATMLRDPVAAVASLDSDMCLPASDNNGTLNTELMFLRPAVKALFTWEAMPAVCEEEHSTLKHMIHQFNVKCTTIPSHSTDRMLIYADAVKVPCTSSPSSIHAESSAATEGSCGPPHAPASF